MTTRRALAAISLSAAALVLTGCSSPAGTGGAGGDGKLPSCPIEAFEKATKPVELNFWYGEMGPPVDAVKHLVQEYNASQDKVVVTATNQGNADEIDAKYRSAAASKQLPDFVELYDIPSGVDSGTLLPAESCMKEAGFDLGTINPAIRATHTIHDKFWPAYLGVNEPIMYFTAPAFEAAGLDPAKPPTNLDEVYAAAKALKAAGIPSPVALTTNRAGAALPVSELVKTWLAASGETFMDHDNGRDGDPDSSTFDNAATRRIYELLAKMKSEGLIKSTTGVNNLYGLAEGSVGITFDVSGAALGIAQVIGSDKDAAAAVRSAQLPGLDGPVNSAGLPGPGFFIVNKSAPEVQGAAWDFASFLLKEDQGVQWLKEASYVPWLTDVAGSARTKSFLDGGTTDARLLQPAVEQLAGATTSDASAHSPTDVISPIDNSIQALLTTDTSVDAAIKQTVDQMNIAIQRYYH